MASAGQALVAALCGIMVMMRAAQAIKYTVGGAKGWVVGEDMVAWAAEYKFYVGDELYFPYPYGQSSVLLVTEEDYKDCNFNKGIASDGGLGDMVMTLLTAETYFFISGHADQCTEGLRLEVPVLEVPSTGAALTPPGGEGDHTPPANTNIPTSPVILTPPGSINTPYSTLRPTSSSPPLSSISSVLFALILAVAFTYLAL